MTVTRLSEKSSSPFPREFKKPVLLVATMALLGGALIFLNGPTAADGPRGAGAPQKARVQSSPKAERSPKSRPLPPAAKRVAASWIETYASSSAFHLSGRMLEEIRRYSIPRLIREMSSNSGAPAFVQRRKHLKRKPVAEVKAVHLQDGSIAGPSVVVIYERRTLTGHGRSSELRTSTLGLKRTQRGWKVSEVLVP